MNHMESDHNDGVGTLEPTSRRLQTAIPVDELAAEDTDSSVDLDALQFRTTAEIEPLDEIVGQSRAMSALDVGLGISQHGYNIFAAGLSGTGKMETIRRSLQRHLDGSVAPDDWIYVHNFDDADQPWAIRLKPGQGRRLEKEMDHLVDQLREALPKAFRQQEFREEKEQLSRKYETKLDDLTNRLSDMAKERGFEVAFLPTGQISFLPHIDGKPADNPQQLETLPPEERDRIAEGERELAREVAHLMQDQRQMVQSLTDEVRDVEKQFAGYVVSPLIEAIKQSYADNARLTQYLDRVRSHILDNVADFRERSPAQAVPPQFQEMIGPDNDRQFFEYRINVIVDNSQTRTAPIIVEEAPTYRNLFGSIDRIVDRRGRLVTDFTQIKAGSLLRANGGYLVFN
ncbi:MAG: ATP-binding protein, partial [Phycisphaerales bacterium]